MVTEGAHIKGGLSPNLIQVKVYTSNRKTEYNICGCGNTKLVKSPRCRVCNGKIYGKLSKGKPRRRESLDDSHLYQNSQMGFSANTFMITILYVTLTTL